MKDAAYYRTYYRKRKKEAMARLGGKCSVCGTEENLEFDHIDPSTKTANLTHIVKGAPRREAEIKHCQLLCKPCHAEKTGKAKHGTGGMYRHHKCRCALCREVNRQYVQACRKRRKAR